MESSIVLGRIFGVRIGINWTWIFVAALITWSLATVVFPDQNPGLSRGAYWAMGAVAAVAFFASILLHELGHAVQAQRDGVGVDEITLWLFGGVAKLRGSYRTPGEELRIALAGPAVTVVIAAVLIAIAAATDISQSVDGVLAWLGYINVILLVFNMLPALPLDGGRVLHALLWQAKGGDLAWATRVGTSIGRGFGFLIIGAGIALFIAGAFTAGIWLAFIGWFLMAAAAAEAQQVLAREALGDLRVGDVMVGDPVTVPPEMTLTQFVDDVLWEWRYTTYPVVDDGRAVGLLPFSCVARVPRIEWDRHRIGDCMLPAEEVPRVGRGERVADILPKLGGRPGRALVVDDGRLVGLLSVTDVARLLSGGGLGRELAARGERRGAAAAR